MFIVGVVGIVAVGAAAHDDYSDHRNYRDYSDAGKITSLKGKVERLRKMELEARRLKNEVDSQYKEGLAVLENEALISDGVRNLKSNNTGSSRPTYVKQILHNELKEKIEADLAADKKELADLDAMIMKINKLQLK